VEEMLFKAYRKGEKMLFEGAQGALLDATFGTYPYVTSSCTLSGGIASGLGMGPNFLDRVIGATKAYTTRVGNGPFPTEFSSEELARFPDHTAAREVGVTTGRKRRMGWLDIPLLLHTIHLNGTDSLAVTKLDILDELDSIKICVGYKLHGQALSTFPSTVEELQQVVPVYEAMRGWKSSTGHIRLFVDLPKQAKAYLRRIEELCDVALGLVSVGPSRDQTLWLDRFFEEVEA
jgi:adenylosuccinate synthase